MSDFETAREFAQFIKGLGFRAFVAGGPGGDGRRGYGFITDAEGTRVLSYSMEGSLSGNYGPPSRASGTGWQLPGSIWGLKTAEDVRAALYATAPDWIARGSENASGFRYYCTLAQHLGMYGSSSKYQEI
jgi:hypothetical protein